VGAAKLRPIELCLGELRVALALGHLALLVPDAYHSRRSVHTAHRRAGFAWFGIFRLPRAELAVLAALMFQEYHRRFLVFCAVSAALSARHPVCRMDRIASIEGAPGRPDIHHCRFMDKAPSSALTWRSKDGNGAAPRPITQLACDVHHDICLMHDAKESNFSPGYVETRLRTAAGMRAFFRAYVDHTRFGVDLT
jgi:hypothetical protein